MTGARSATVVDSGRRPIGTGALVGARLLGAGLGWMGTVLVARQLSTAEFGAFSFVFGLLGLVGLFSDLAVGRVVLRDMMDPALDQGRVVSSYVGLRFLVSLLAYLVAVGFVVVADYPSDVVASTAIAGLLLIIAAPIAALAVLAQAQLRLTPLAIALVIAQLCQLALLVALIVSGSTRLEVLVVPAVMGQFIAILWLWRLINRTVRIRARVDVAAWRRWMKEAAPLALGTTLAALYFRVDIVLLSMFDSLEAVGRYNIGYKFSDLAGFIPQALLAPVLPMLVMAWPLELGNFRTVFRRALVVLLAVATGVSVGFTLVAQPVVTLFYGREFSSSSTAAVILVVAQTLQFFSSLCMIALVAMARYRIFVIAGAVGLVLNLVLNVVLIGPLSYNGSALATVLTEVVVLALLAGALTHSRVLPGVIPWRIVAQLGGVAAAMVVARFVPSVVGLPWPFGALLSGATFLVGVSLIRTDDGGRIWTQLSRGPVEARAAGSADDGHVASRAQVVEAQLGRAGGQRHPRRRSVGFSASAVAVVALIAVINVVIVLHPAVGVGLLVVALVVPCLVFLAARPQRGIVLLALLVPFHGLLPILPGPGILAGWKEVLVVWTLLASIPQGYRQRRRSDPLPPWTPALAGLLALAVLSAMAVGGTQAVLGLKIGFFYVLVFISCWLCPPTRRDRDHLVTGLMVVGAVTAAFGIVQQLLGPSRLAALGWTYNTNIRYLGGQLRSFSTFNQNFSFALFLMLVLLLGLAQLAEDPRRVRNQWFLLSMPLLLVALFFTSTRSAWLGLIIGLIYLGCSRYRTLLRPLLMIGGLGLIGVFFKAASFSTNSFLERLTIWTDNIGSTLVHPFGSGIGSTGSAAEKTQLLSQPKLGTTVLQVDNYYLKVLLELGPLGLWLMCLLLASVLVWTHRISRSQRGADRALVLAVTASIIAATVISWSSTYFEVFPMDVYFWLLLGVVAACHFEPPDRRAAERDRLSSSSSAPGPEEGVPSTGGDRRTGRPGARPRTPALSRT